MTMSALEQHLEKFSRVVSRSREIFIETFTEFFTVRKFREILSRKQ